MFTQTKTVTFRPTLRLGSVGTDVKDLQKVLNVTVANNSIVVDGIFGSKTKELVIAFQKQHGLVINGIAEAKTWAIVDTIETDEKEENAFPVLCRCSKGKHVEYLQRRLNGIGFGPLGTNGIFTAKTESAVKHFQKVHGLIVNGIVDKFTWAKLESIDV